MLGRIGLLVAVWAAGALTLAPAAYAQQVTLVVAHVMTGGADRVAFDRIVASFEAQHPNIRVRQIAQDDDIYEDQGLITMMKSDRPPDIFFQWGGNLVAEYARQGFAADLTGALAREGWRDTWEPAAWSGSAGTTVDGRIYMLPDSLDVTTVIWYNKRMFRDVALSEPTSWAELLSACRILAARGIVPITLGNKELWPFGNWAGHIVSRVAGEQLYDDVFSRRVLFSNPDFERAFDILRQLGQSRCLDPAMAGTDADPSMLNFFNGRAAMHPIGSWLVPNALRNAPPGFDYDAFNTPPIPGGKGDQASIIGLATGFMVSARTAHFGEAIQFLRFYTRPENQRLMVEAGNISPIKGAFDGAQVPAATRKLGELIGKAKTIVPPPDTGYPVAIADTFYQAAALVAEGRRSPREALQWIDEEIRKMPGM